MDPAFWHTKKNHKFIQNIDTFYYSIKLKEDFRADSIDSAVNGLRDFLDNFELANGSDSLLLGSWTVFHRPGSFAGIYKFRFECPEKFDFFIAPSVPAYAGAESKTSEFVLQLRSRFLWEKGAALAFKESFEFVEEFCKAFDLHIVEVKENRSDFCWHTNAIQAPEKFFAAEKFHKMFVGQVGIDKETKKHSMMQRFVFDQETLENDYIALGARGQRCFVRIYLKSKEVVQQGYKGWFFYIWFYQGLISRYDMFCLEAAYKVRNWLYLDVARLQFALQYMDLDKSTINEIKSLIDGKTSGFDYKAISKLAKKITPEVTKIVNIEFQCMRAMTRTFELIHFKNNEGVTSRIYDFFDNRALITEYLTRKTMRLTRLDSTDSNISRREDCDFWKRLRACKGIDIYLDKHNLHLCRKYSSNLDMSVRKKKAVRAISSVAYALTHNVNTSIYEDAADLLALLNDNDLKDLEIYKAALAKRKQFETPPEAVRFRQVGMFSFC